MTISGPLKGIQILDLTSVGMGPMATQILGDMGADVIKIETAGGDVFRHVHPQRHKGMSHVFLSLNRNKKSMVLDAKTPQGQKIIHQLVRQCDVFISNMRALALSKLGLDHETLERLNPRLIYAVCYGYSQSGTYAGRSAIDDTIQAACSLASFQGHNKSAPEFVNTVTADKIVALYVVNAISMALYERTQSNLGQFIEIPMFECMTSFMAVEHLAGKGFIPDLGHTGYQRVLNPYRKPYASLDGFISVAPYTDEQWIRFFKISRQDELLGDARFMSASARSQHIEVLYSLLEQIIAKRSNEEWSQLLSQADIPFSAVFSLADLVDDPHLASIDFWKEFDHPTEGKIRMAGVPVKFSRTPGEIRSPAPGLGEHTDEIMAQLGLRSFNIEQ
jgi:crotonobetainyl-CoA:carnitine CoA-transferase CaiB-like acyl-CoA transferase